MYKGKNFYYKIGFKKGRIEEKFVNLHDNIPICICRLPCGCIGGM